MSTVRTEPSSPIDNFLSEFAYAWKKENEKPQQSIEHYSIELKVENLTVLSGDKLRISSSTFYLDGSKTSWKIEVLSKGTGNEERSLDLYLRGTQVEGPLAVGLTFRFGLSELSNPDIRWLDAVKFHEFRRGFCRSVHAKGGELVARLTDCKTDFVVTCEMYITYKLPRYDCSLLTAADLDLINFSFDFSQLFTNTGSTDYALKLPKFDVEFRSHKAILEARSKLFSEEILTNPECDTCAAFKDVTPENLFSVLKFIYSGNVSKVLETPPSIGFYECAKKFRVSDLEALLFPKRIQLKCTFKTLAINFMWHIKNFSKIPIDDDGICRVKSPEFGAAAPNAAKLVLSMYLLKSLDQLSIYAETDRVTEAHRSILTISLLNGNNRIINTKLTSLFRGPKEKFGFVDYMNRFSVQARNFGLVVNDTLQVDCKFQFITCDDIIESQFLHSHGTVTFLDYYRNLSDDISKLFETAIEADGALRLRNGKQIAVHKSVLIARSEKFWAMFLYNNILDVTDIRQESVAVMIRHAYSGILYLTSVEDMVILRRDAELYSLKKLTLIILYRLADHINVDNFFKLYCEAREPHFGNPYLKCKCEAFIRENTREIFQKANWKQWEQENPETFTIVSNLLYEWSSTTN